MERETPACMRCGSSRRLLAYRRNEPDKVEKKGIRVSVLTTKEVYLCAVCMGVQEERDDARR